MFTWGYRIRARRSPCNNAARSYLPELGCSSELEHGWTLLEENGAVRQHREVRRAGLEALLRSLVEETEPREEQSTAEPELVCT
jgi:hypothetical protein